VVKDVVAGMRADMATARTQLVRGLLACVVVAGSLAVWTAVPVGWIYLVGDLVSGGGPRFVLVIFGCPLAMALVCVLLIRVEAYRRRLSPAGEPWSLLEVALVSSAVAALVGLVLWWALLADNPSPSGPLQPL
jgi:hypothetical protein